MDQEPSAERPGPPQDPPTRKEQAYELCVFLFLIVPTMIISFFVLGQISTAGFTLTALDAILRDLSLLLLVLYFIHRNNEPLSSIGLIWKNGWHEVLLGIALFPAFLLIVSIIGSILQSMGFSIPSEPPSFLKPDDPLQMTLALCLVVVVAVVEETIFRGYLILRLIGIGKGKAWAVLFSSFIFLLGHGYEGSAGVITVGLIGVMLALLYLWRGCLTAPIVIHFLQNFIGIIVVPLLDSGF